MFVEEPVLPEHAHAYRGLSDGTSIPLAAGERVFSRYEVRPILEAGGISILQPDSP